VGRDAERTLLRYFDVVGKEALGGKTFSGFEIGAKERRKGRLVLLGPKKFTGFRKTPSAAMGLTKGKR